MNFCAVERRNWRLNWGFPRNDPKQYQIFILGLICPREPVLVTVDGKIYYFEVITRPLFPSLAQNKYNNGRNYSDKSKISRRAMILGMHAKKSTYLDYGKCTCFTKCLRHFDKPWLQLLGLHTTCAFLSRMFLKLFLKLVQATEWGNTKFQIFWRCFAIFYTLNEFLRGGTP